jgi:dihydroxyacid dehydratase/phosphogluconate dehydratase
VTAARFDLPTIYLSAGPCRMDIRKAAGQRGSIDHGDYGDDLSLLVKTTTCSTCEIMATANTFQRHAGAFGLCLPGTSNIPGWQSDKPDAARRTGRVHAPLPQARAAGLRGGGHRLIRGAPGAGPGFDGEE